MNDNKGGNSGFLLGLIIGGAAVFLLGTGKGRKILQSLTEQGFEELENVLERAEEELEDEEPAPVSTVRKAKVVEEEEVSIPHMNEVKSNGHAATAATKRRFFRRARS